MTSSNGNIFRVTGPLCGEFTGPGEFPAQRPVTWSFDVFFDLRPDKRLSKQPWGWWFETPSWSLWSQCNVFAFFYYYSILKHYRVLRFTFRGDEDITMSHSQYHGCWWPGNARDQILNPLPAKFFRGSKNIYLHFMSFLYIDMTQVIGILPCERRRLAYFT